MVQKSTMMKYNNSQLLSRNWYYQGQINVSRQNVHCFGVASAVFQP